MHLSHPTTHPAERRLVHEGGFSMFLVIMVMFVTSMFVAAGFAAANGDLPLSGNWRDRKTAYAAAEAGLNFYQYHLDQDNDYWLKCTTVNPPNGTEPSPVNLAWDGTGPSDPRKWRKVPGSEAGYTIELLPAPGKDTCVKDDQESMIDPRTGTFRIRVTGRAYAGSKVRRSIVASFRRKSFLDFLWFTHFETTDPKNYLTGGTMNPTWAANNCAFTRPSRDPGCLDINFVTGDWMHGPMHSDDNFYICGQPKFGRDDPDANDVIEVSGSTPSQGWVPNTGGSCAGAEDPIVYPDDKIDSGVGQITLPTTNSSLKSLAKGVYSFVGKTTIVLNGNTMTVTNAKANPPLNNTSMALPANGVIYVDNEASPACVPTPPRSTDYAATRDPGCGNLFVGGHANQSLTLAAKNDVIVTRTLNPGRNMGLLRDDDAVMLGLVADNFVRVQHLGTDAAANFQIDAAILALSHSFTVDNYEDGPKLGNLTVNGAIAQLYRGAVGQTGTSGYLKDYWYDDRLKYQTPPYFLQPVAASWHVMRRNEQVPAR